MATPIEAPSSSSSLLAALSPSGSHVAVVVPTNNNNASMLIRIQVYQLTATSTSFSLQTTLTHRSSSSSSSSTTTAPVELFWAGPSKICLLTSSQQVLVWDLTRGVLAHTIQAKEKADQQILHHAAAAAKKKDDSEEDLLIHVLYSSKDSGKLVIHECDASSGKLLRKIKAGSRHDKTSSAPVGSSSLKLAVTPNHFVVREGDQLRILRADTGEKVTKKKLKLAKKKSSESSSSSSSTMSVVGGATTVVGTLGAAIVSGARQVVLFDVSKGTIAPTSKTIPMASSSAIHENSLELWEAAEEVDESSFYLYNDQVLYKLESKKSSGTDGQHAVDEVEVKWKSKVQSDSSIERQVVLGQGEELIAVMFKAGQFQLEKVSLADRDGKNKQGTDIALTWMDPESETVAMTSAKRKCTTTGIEVLGPGQAGGESTAVSEGPEVKRMKKDDDDDKNPNEDDDDMDDDEDDEGPTIAERLKKLEEALMEDESEQEQEWQERMEKAREMGLVPSAGQQSRENKFQPKQATTESLTKILEQALQSGDNKMLELAFCVKDKSTLAATCQSLKSEYMPKLLTALTTRLAMRPTRAVPLSYWLTAVLQSGRLTSSSKRSSSSSSSANAAAQMLQPLRNLLDERVELFPEFLKLRGRMSMMEVLQKEKKQKNDSSE